MNVFQERGITHLDLHGLRHHQVKNEVIDFVFQYQDKIPLIIICGNSNQMMDHVEVALNEENIGYSSPRFGIIRIERI